MSETLQIELNENNDYIPFEHRRHRYPTSNLDTLMHVIKGALGSGILTMPLAFKNAGLWTGFTLIWIIGAIVTYGLYLVVKCSHIICTRTKVPSLNYAETAEMIFKFGPPRFRKYSKSIRILVNFMLFTDLFGSCCVCVVFIAKNVAQFVEFHINGEIDSRYVMLCLFFPLSGINMLGKLKWLAPFSTLANILLFSGFCVLMIYMTKDASEIVDRPFIEIGIGIPLFFGAVLFAISCVGVIMALENNMKYPNSLIGFPGVLFIGISIVTALNCATGFMGYYRYGDNIQESVTLNLPMNEGYKHRSLAQSVKIMMAIAVICTHALTFYVPMEIILGITSKKCPGHPRTTNFSLRLVLVASTILIAIIVPNLISLMGLIGSFALSTLTFLIPATLDILLYWEETNGMGKYYWRLWKNVSLILFSLFGFIFGGYSSILNLYRSYNENV